MTFVPRSGFDRSCDSLFTGRIITLIYLYVNKKIKILINLIAKAGLEPARSYLQRILSSQRLPFRHLALLNQDRAIRTPDLRIPNAALYQAKLQLVGASQATIFA